MLVSSVLMIIVMMTLPSCTESQSSQMLFCTFSFNVRQPKEVGFLCPVYGRRGLRDGCLGFLNQLVAMSVASRPSECHPGLWSGEKAGTSSGPCQVFHPGMERTATGNPLFSRLLNPRKQACPGSEAKGKWDGENSKEVEGLSEESMQPVGKWGEEQPWMLGRPWCLLG